MKKSESVADRIDYENKRKQIPFYINFSLGAVSAAFTKSAGAPMERAKLILQSQEAHPKIIKNPSLAYKGIFDVFYRVYYEEGLFALWRGNLSNIMRYIPQQAFNFAFKDSFQKQLSPDQNIDNKVMLLLCNVLSGAIAAAVTSCMIYPLDFTRTRLAVDLGSTKNRKFTGIVNCMSSIVKTDGITGLYRGFLLNVPNIMLYRGIYFGFYDTVKNSFTPETSRLYKLLVASVTTSSASFIVYPMDTVRRRMMMRSGESNIDVNKLKT